MPVDFPCTQCKRPLRVGEEFVGKQVRCPDCKQVLTVPKPVPMAKPVQADAIPTLEPVESPAPPEKPKATPPRAKKDASKLQGADLAEHELALEDDPFEDEIPLTGGKGFSAGLDNVLESESVKPVVRKDRSPFADEPLDDDVFEDEDYPTRSSRREPRRSSRGTRDPYDDPDYRRSSGFPMGLLLALGLGGVFLFVVVAGAVLYFSMSAGRAKKVAQASAAVTKKTGPNKPPPVDDLAEAMPLLLEDGRLDERVEAPSLRDEVGRIQAKQVYTFRPPESGVYWFQMVSPKVNLRITLVSGGMPPGMTHRRQRGDEYAFSADKRKTYKIEVTSAFDMKTRLTIRHMDGSEPLPEQLELKFEYPPTLPEIQAGNPFNDFYRVSSGAAFSPTGKACVSAHRNLLMFWKLPSEEPTVTFTTEEDLCALALDASGRLYAQAQPTIERGRHSGHDRVASEILVYENLPTEGEKLPLPKPTKTLGEKGIVARFVSARGQPWLFFLDTQRKVLCRINTKTATVDRTIDNLSDGAVDFCLTPNGRTIYVVSKANVVDVVDAWAFRLKQSIKLDRGHPHGIAASNDGKLFFVTEDAEDDDEQKKHAWVAKLADPLPKELELMPLPVRHKCHSVRRLPNDRGVIFGGETLMTALACPQDPRLYKAVSKEGRVKYLGTPGFFVIDPKGTRIYQEATGFLRLD